MSETPINIKKAFADLPPEWGNDPMPGIIARLKESRTKIVVLDDDPTGTQTVHGIPVLTTWATESLKTELVKEEKAFFILTNSRGLTPLEANTLAREVGENLKTASEHTGVPVSVISRSDSTLRGHFPEEVDETAKAMGKGGLPYLICPFFLEGGRFTLNNVHYVAQDEELVPAAQTPYAKDASFGFTRSNLCEWVEEKTSGRITADQVTAVTLDEIRRGGPEEVCRILMSVPRQGACFVNAASYRDIEVLVQGLLEAGARGSHFLYRTAASFVRVRAGVLPRETYLSREELVTGSGSGGLFVVGSYVPKTTAQVRQLIDNTDIHPIEVDVRSLLTQDTRESAVRQFAEQVNQSILSGRDTVLYTSRELVRSEDPEKSLEIGQIVSRCLIRIVQMLECRPGYLVAKGGITSSDVATQALKVKRAVVSGQVLPGVPVWQLGDESAYPGMSYIIFPGNVGEDNALMQVQKKLSPDHGGRP